MSPKETYVLLELVADIYDAQKPKSMSKAIREATEIYERARKNPLASRVDINKLSPAMVRKLAE